MNFRLINFPDFFYVSSAYVSKAKIQDVPLFFLQAFAYIYLLFQIPKFPVEKELLGRIHTHNSPFSTC